MYEEVSIKFMEGYHCEGIAMRITIQYREGKLSTNLILPPNIPIECVNQCIERSLREAMKAWRMPLHPRRNDEDELF